MKYDRNIIEALEKAVSDSLEGMAFAEIENSEKLSSLPKFSDQDYFTSIDLKSPLRGQLQMVVGEKHAFDIVASTLGQDNLDELGALVADSIGEYANTIAGCFMRNLLNDEEYELGLPVYGRIAEKKDSLELHSDSMFLSFDIEENKIYLTFSAAWN